MAYYQRYIDCAKEHSDWYVNTPAVSKLRSETPRFLTFRWTTIRDMPAPYVIEFFNFQSMMRSEIEQRTITSRGSDATQSKFAGFVPIAPVVAVPCGAMYFRVRFDDTKVSRLIEVHNNDAFFVEAGEVFELYNGR